MGKVLRFAYPLCLSTTLCLPKLGNFPLFPLWLPTSLLLAHWAGISRSRSEVVCAQPSGYALDRRASKRSKEFILPGRHVPDDVPGYIIYIYICMHGQLATRRCHDRRLGLDRERDHVHVGMSTLLAATDPLNA